jgi:hypothetical protein
MSILTEIARSIAGSPLNEIATDLLRNVPGLPPIVQTVHIFSVACVMASIVMIDLRVLGFALPSQSPQEMIRRLMPWFWTALVLLALSGLMFVFARPRRYFVNPVFGAKFAFLALALFFTLIVQRLVRTSANPALAKSMAALSLLAWFGVVLAGRWIAYADYLFPPE